MREEEHKQALERILKMGCKLTIMRLISKLKKRRFQYFSWHCVSPKRLELKRLKEGGGCPIACSISVFCDVWLWEYENSNQRGIM